MCTTTRDPTVTSALHASASGKLLMSGWTPQQRAAFLGKEPFVRFTPYTLTTVEELESDLKASSARGYFTVNDEAMLGMSSIAAPLDLHGNLIGCLVAFGTSFQLPREGMHDRGLVVKRAADMLSAMSPAIRALEPLLVRNGRGLNASKQAQEHAELPAPARGASRAAAKPAPAKASRRQA